MADIFTTAVLKYYSPGAVEIDPPVAGEGISVVDYGPAAVGDVVLDLVAGDDANGGTNAPGDGLATWAAAYAEAVSSAASKIKVIGDAAKLRTTWTFENTVDGADENNKFVIEPVGTDRPILTAAEILPNLVDVGTADDIARLGPVKGASGSGVYVSRNFPLSDLQTDNQSPFALNIHEGATRLDLCRLWDNTIYDHFYLTNADPFVEPDGGQQTSGVLLTGYTHSALTAYTEEQILNCKVFGIADPLVWYKSDIATFNTSTGAFTLVETDNKWQDPVLPSSDRFALYNLLPEIKQGQWGYWLNADGLTVDIYVQPYAPINVGNGIEYTKRPHCMVTNRMKHITVRGFTFQQAAGDTGDRDGTAIASWEEGTGNPALYNDGLTFENCLIKNCINNRNAGVSLYRCNDLIFHNCQIEYIQIGYGLKLAGFSNNPTYTGAIGMEHLSIQNCLVNKSEDSPYRFTAVWDMVFAFCSAINSGLSPHGNKSNWYEQCHRILVWGVKYFNCQGYVTLQRSSGLAVAFCTIPWDTRATASSSYSFQDQNAMDDPKPQDYLPVGEQMDCYMFNNTMPPSPEAVGGTAISLSLTSSLVSYDNVQWHVANNLYHGFFVERTAQISEWKNNWNTRDSDPNFDVSDVSAVLTDVYVDAANGDWNIKPGAAIRTATGYDISSWITTLQGHFGDRFTRWDEDGFGNSINPILPNIGASSNHDYSAFFV